MISEQRFVILPSSALDTNDARREACEAVGCDQLASYRLLSRGGTDAGFLMCKEHATGHARVYALSLPARYVCSGDGPGVHVDCDFETESESAAMRHFERTAHSVDRVADTPVCIAGTEHGDCGLPANYAFVEPDRTTYACALHVRRIGNDMLDYASEFTYRVLNP